MIVRKINDVYGVFSFLFNLLWIGITFSHTCPFQALIIIITALLFTTTTIRSRRRYKGGYNTILHTWSAPHQARSK